MSFSRLGLALCAGLLLGAGFLGGCSSSSSSGGGILLQMKTVEGTVRETGGAGLPGVTVTAMGATAVTDGNGNFILVNTLPVGDVLFLFDGTTVNQAGKQFPVLDVIVPLVSGDTATLPQPITLPNLMNPSSSNQTVTVDGNGATTAPISTGGGRSDLQVSGNTGTVITIDGQPASAPVNLNVTPVPPQEVPMPLPEVGLVASSFVTVQPGGARFNPPLDITLPNDLNYPIGTQVQIWSFDHDEGMWVNRSSETGQMGTVVDAGGGATQIEASNVITEGGWHAPVIDVDPDCVTTFAGHVQNGGSGDPLANVSIALSTGQFTQTDSNGDFSIPSVPAYDIANSTMGTCVPTEFSYEIVAPPSFGSVSMSGSIPAGSVQVGGTTSAGDVRLTIPSTGSIAGFVNGIGAFPDQPVIVSGQNLLQDLPIVPNSDGSFFVSNLEAGEYLTSFLFQGSPTPVEEMVDVVANRITTVNLQFMSGGGSDLINVAVFLRSDEDGPLSPLPAASVRLQGTDSGSSLGIAGMTDASGIATFENVSGPFNVTAQIDQTVPRDGEIRVVRFASSLIGVDPVGTTIGVFIDSSDEDNFTPVFADSTMSGTFNNIPQLKGGRLELFVQSTGGGADEFFNQTNVDGSGNYSIGVSSGRNLAAVAVQYDPQNRVRNTVFVQSIPPVSQGSTFPLDFDFDGPNSVPFDQSIDVSFINAASNPFFHDVFLCLDDNNGTFIEFELAGPSTEFSGGDVTVYAPNFASPVFNSFNAFLATEQEFTLPESQTLVSSDCAYLYTTTPSDVEFIFNTVPTPISPAQSDSFPAGNLNQLPVNFNENEFGRAGNGFNSVLIDNPGAKTSGIPGIDQIAWTFFLPTGTSDFTVPPAALPMFADGMDYFLVLEKHRAQGVPVDFNNFFDGNLPNSVISFEQNSVTQCISELEILFSTDRILP